MADPRRQRGVPGRARAVVALLALLGAIGLASPAPARASPASTPAAASAPAADQGVSASVLETRYGLRVTRVAVTGGGGLVDLRFTVLDPVKAAPLLAGHGQALRLLVEQGDVALTAPHHGGGRSVRLEKDAACFVLFPNARGAVRPGARVAVAFGQVRSQPVKAL